jgi:hypothetical protein
MNVPSMMVCTTALRPSRTSRSNPGPMTTTRTAPNPISRPSAAVSPARAASTPAPADAMRSPMRPLVYRGTDAAARYAQLRFCSTGNRSNDGCSGPGKPGTTIGGISTIVVGGWLRAV